MNTLEQQLLDLAQMHGLTTISLTVYNDTKPHVSAAVHRGNVCATDKLYGAESLSDAMKDAILRLNEKAVIVSDFVPVALS